MESARMEYWKKVMGLNDFTKADFIVAHAEIDYRTPTKISETLLAWARISSIGNRSFVFDYLIEEKTSKRLI